MLTGKEIVLGVTGSIACYKAVELLRELIRREASVTVVMTEGARQFITPLTFATLSKRPVLTDLFTLDYGSRIAHVSTAEGADLLLVAPATADILGKFANGLADDLLTNLFLAAHVPVLIAPAMDRQMWQHPAVQENVKRLKERGVRFVGPEVGELASGLYGPGRLAEVSEIVRAVEALLSPQDLSGEVVLVTAGPTQEPLDPIRYVSNRSSGKMGYAIAEAALARGAKVILVSGPTALKPPPQVETTFVQTAGEMREAVLKSFPDTTIVIKAAAVADYRPARMLPSKLKKTEEPISLEFVPTSDILEELGKKKEGRILVGFAAETENVIERAREKLLKKNLDLVVANDVTKEGAGFGAEMNLVTILDREGNVEELPLLSKAEVAHRILDRVVALLPRRRGR